MTEQELRQLFKNRSNCYADTRHFREDRTMGESLYEEGKVVQAVTEDIFIDILKEAGLLKESKIKCGCGGNKIMTDCGLVCDICG